MLQFGQCFDATMTLTLAAVFQTGRSVLGYLDSITLTRFPGSKNYTGLGLKRATVPHLVLHFLRLGSGSACVCVCVCLAWVGERSILIETRARTRKLQPINNSSNFFKKERGKKRPLQTFTKRLICSSRDRKWAWKAARRQRLVWGRDASPLTVELASQKQQSGTSVQFFPQLCGIPVAACESGVCYQLVCLAESRRLRRPSSCIIQRCTANWV